MENRYQSITLPIDEIISEAIRREKMLLNFYEHAMDGSEPDARLLLMHLMREHHERITQLERLRDELSRAKHEAGHYEER
jgi:hypothetical protein